MEQTHIPRSPGAPPARSASAPATDPAAPPDLAPRRARHDGWTPDRQAVFLEALAACGVIADAARQAGMSAQGAYAFRNRRAGRAFATAWDAVLIHRARVRLGDELISRALNGVTETVRDKDGEVAGERHRFDNRLSMAVLTRLDRLAEAAGDRADQLRAVSEDMEDLLDCLDGGGDAGAFVDARRPAPELEPARPASNEAEDARPAHAGLAFFDIWQDGDDEWRTNYPPPADFDGEEEGSRGSISYVRALSPRECEVVAADQAADYAALIADRDRVFGFAGGGAADPGAWPGDGFDPDDGYDGSCADWDWDHAARAAAAAAGGPGLDRSAAWQPSTSSTSPPPAPIAPADDPPDMDAR